MRFERPHLAETLVKGLDEEMNREKTIFLDVILPKLERTIAHGDFLVGEHLTAADLAVFHELQNIMAMADIQQIDRNLYPSLSGWSTRVQEHEEVS